MEQKETYTLDLGSERRFIYVHKPSYEKNLAIFNQWPNAFRNAARMERSCIEKAKLYKSRGNIELAEEWWNKGEAWMERIEKALKGNPDEFFKKMNNIKPVD